MSDLTKPPSSGGGIQSTAGKINITGKRNASALHERINAAAVEEKKASALDPLTAEYRIAIMADVSGSMGGDKIRSLQDALSGFTSMCDPLNTAISIETFPQRGSYPLSRDKQLITAAVLGLHACGGTPMHEAMDFVLNSVPLTRGIIISDGEANSDAAALECADHYAEQETIIDCVHIGHDTGGEELLKEIARRTGGAYIKFTDIASFAKSFAYLTPAKRGELKAAIAGLLGAKEVIV